MVLRKRYYGKQASGPSVREEFEGLLALAKICAVGQKKLYERVSIPLGERHARVLKKQAVRNQDINPD